MELGPVSDGIFWDLVEMLYEENGYLSIKDMPLYAKMLNVDEHMLNKVVTDLFLIDGDRFYNQSLLDRLDKITDIIGKRSFAGKASGKARQKNTCSTSDEHLSNNIKEIKEIKEIHIHDFFAYFILRTKKSFKLSPARRTIIEGRLKDHTLEQLKVAVDNFIQDDWQDRHKFIDIVYCIGIRNKIDNLEKWLNWKPKELTRRMVS